MSRMKCEVGSVKGEVEEIIEWCWVAFLLLPSNF